MLTSKVNQAWILNTKNPNGSIIAIEGITSKNGQIIGGNGSSERFGDGLFKTFQEIKTNTSLRQQLNTTGKIKVYKMTYSNLLMRNVVFWNLGPPRRCLLWAPWRWHRGQEGQGSSPMIWTIEASS